MGGKEETCSNNMANGGEQTTNFSLHRAKQVMEDTALQLSDFNVSPTCLHKHTYVPTCTRLLLVARSSCKVDEFWAGRPPQLFAAPSPDSPCLQANQPTNSQVAHLYWSEICQSVCLSVCLSFCLLFVCQSVTHHCV